MPYEVSFTKRVGITDTDQYINNCCFGGDIVLRQLLPALSQEFGELGIHQEDWGWFIWFTSEGIRLAVDVVCDDPIAGAFRIHLTSRVSRILFGRKVVDTVQLERLRNIVVNVLSQWIGSAPQVASLDSNYMPTGECS